MKRRWINKNLLIAGICFILFIGIVFLSEFNVIGNLNSVKVVLANKELSPNTVITSKDIKVENYPIDLYNPNMIVEPNQVIGKRVVTTVPSNGFFTPSTVDESSLRPEKDSEFIPIPKNWIYDQLQGSLRRYDRVNIIAVKVPTQNNQNNNGTENNMDPSSYIQEEHIYTDIPVVFVKSNKNSEIEGANGTNDRLNGNGTPSELQLSLTLKQFNKLEELYLQGYKFIFSS